jgi:hypothetical protein
MRTSSRRSTQANSNGKARSLPAPRHEFTSLSCSYGEWHLTRQRAKVAPCDARWPATPSGGSVAAEGLRTSFAEALPETTTNRFRTVDIYASSVACGTVGGDVVSERRVG